jgi:hypothetical protein
MNQSAKRPVRFFNTTGPCNPEDHYMLPPADRLIGAQLPRYIRDKLYWVLHAPRQTGKTTFLQNWMREINVGSEALACYVSVERCQGVAETDKAMPDICKAIQEYAASFGVLVPELKTAAVNSMLSDILINWSALIAPKPLIVLFDEVDVLEGDALISFLRQLRSGFAARGPGLFPVSIALVGMRDLKDYITAAKGGTAPNPGSPFNIKEDSAALGNFRKEDIIKLFAQRTLETGQKITPEALDYVYGQSEGQPWIVNSLFKRATMRVLDEENSETVTMEHVVRAREQMIEARETHLDALEVRLRDGKIRRVVESIIAGETDLSITRTNPDVELAMDLGLISWHTETGFTIANPIYEEILTRHLNAPYHDNLPPPSSWNWKKVDGSLDMDNLLREFQGFWRKNSETWEQKADYTEVFPHLLTNKQEIQPFDKRPNPNVGIEDIDAMLFRDCMDELKLPKEKPLENYFPDTEQIAEFVPPLLVKNKLDDAYCLRNFTLFLFGKKTSYTRCFPDMYTVISFYNGTDRSEPNAMRYELTGPIIVQSRKALEILDMQIYTIFDKTSVRPNQVKYPKRALQEALINAIVHRDYEISEPTRVTVFSDRIEIMSPGRLQWGVDKKKFLSGKASPKWRNQSFAYLFNKLHLSQSEGQGIPTIFRTMKEEGCPDPVFELGEDSVTCILPANPLYKAVQHNQ